MTPKIQTGEGWAQLLFSRNSETPDHLGLWTAELDAAGHISSMGGVPLSPFEGEAGFSRGRVPDALRPEWSVEVRAAEGSPGTLLMAWTHSDGDEFARLAWLGLASSSEEIPTVQALDPRALLHLPGPFGPPQEISFANEQPNGSWEIPTEFAPDVKGATRVKRLCVSGYRGFKEEA